MQLHSMNKAKRIILLVDDPLMPVPGPGGGGATKHDKSRNMLIVFFNLNNILKIMP